MLRDSLLKIFDRDLKRLRSEIEAYQDENTLWVIDNNITNSGGNLCLHLIGNLNTFIGSELGKTKYTRNREFEFSGKNVPKNELLDMIDETSQLVVEALSDISEKTLNSDYPIEVFQSKMTTEFFLIHLTTHLSYHLGQINYHRRLLDV